MPAENLPIFPSERNQIEEAIKYALARGEDLQPDELQMLIMLQDDGDAFVRRLKAAGWKPPKRMHPSGASE